MHRQATDWGKKVLQQNYVSIKIHLEYLPSTCKSIIGRQIPSLPKKVREELRDLMEVYVNSHKTHE